MPTGSSVVLELDNEDGLQGWNCHVYRGQRTNVIKLRLKNNSVNLAFEPNSLNVPETIFWCTDMAQRSNQITVRTSEKDVMLEMDPLPVTVGKSLTLRCRVWGTDRISHTVFYKDDAVILSSQSPTHQINNVTESAIGRYKCEATYTHVARTKGPPYQEVSDNQDLFVQAPSMRALLSANRGMSCTCPTCDTNDVSYRWYYKNDDGQPWKLMVSSEGFMMPKASGTYACRAVWNNRRSFLSNSYVYQPPISFILKVVIIVLAILGFAAVAFYIWYRNRNTTGPIYEDVALRSRDKDDDKYETLQKPRGEGEYDTLHPEAPGRERKEGEYQPLKREEMKDGVYHTLGMEGAGGGAGGYEALKKEGRKEGVYHTLGMEGAAGGAGGYEALKKEGRKEGVYHTLEMEGAGGGEGD
ncbi:uncharacterized protein [Enoplosus armatus]|uniref:uncharacterized protein n=1 Tax=Enoplosus armatus TaxID=215367 RepID=UPI003991FD2B